MELVSGFVALLQRLSATMITPTFARLATVLTGWGFARRRAVTRMILAVGDTAGKRFSSYRRLFSAACWSLDALGLAMLGLMPPFLGSVILLGLDDTLARKRGVKMFGTDMHHDRPYSSCRQTITNWGQGQRPKVGRGVLRVIVELPFRRGHSARSNARPLWPCCPCLYCYTVHQK